VGAVALVAVLSACAVLLSLPTLVPGPREGGSHSVLPPIGTPSAVRLPGFNPLYQYSYGNNYLLRYLVDAYNFSQVPVLADSPEQPFGIYYINNHSELVVYNLTTEVVRVVANVTLLYQTWAAYQGMLANEFTLAYGLDEALFFGTLTPESQNVSIETVNLTTGAVHLMNTGLPITPENQQVNLIGPDTAVVFSTLQTEHPVDSNLNATITGFNLVNGTSWNAGTLPWFEANNVYWLSQKAELLNVQAHDSDNDTVEQLNESRNAFGEPVFVSAATVKVDSGVSVNWVDGIAYNASTDRVAYSNGGHGVAVTYVLGYSPSGLLTTYGESRYGGNGSTPYILNGQYYVYTSNFLVGGAVNGTQYDFDPWNGTVEPAGESSTGMTPDVCDGSCFLGQQSTGLEYSINFAATVKVNYPFWAVVVEQPHAVPTPTGPEPRPVGTPARTTADSGFTEWMHSPIGAPRTSRGA
jgi:hypothetical protein